MKIIISTTIVKPEWLEMTKEDKDYYFQLDGRILYQKLSDLIYITEQ